MLTGLREAKFFRNKKINVRFFPDGEPEELQYNLIPYVTKIPDNTSICIDTTTVYIKLKTLSTRKW